MADALTLYLVAVAGTVVFFFAAFVYYEADATPGQTLDRKGLSPERVTTGVVLSFAAVAALALRGSTPPPLSDGFEGFAYTVLGWSLVLLFGLLGLGAAYGFARRWRRFHPDNDTPTGAVGGGPVACTGTAIADEGGTAPVTGREAVCWEWSVEVLDPDGVSEVGQRERYRVVDGGSDGIVFTVDDGTGPIRIDPTGGTVNPTAERSVALDAGESPPERFTNPAPDVERQHADKAREYTESVIAPGDTVAVSGTARAGDTTPVVEGDASVTVGTLATAATRYRRRALLYTAGGLVGVCVGLWGLAGTFGVPLA